MELAGATISVSSDEERRRRARKEASGMLDFEQQANQAQALASLDDDWHLLEGERTTFAIFLFPFPAASSKARQHRQDDAIRCSQFKLFPRGEKGQPLKNVRLPSSDEFEDTS